jgi:uncharacterized protein GlcG (DUF336 family)
MVHLTPAPTILVVPILALEISNCSKFLTNGDLTMNKLSIAFMLVCLSQFAFAVCSDIDRNPFANAVSLAIDDTIPYGIDDGTTAGLGMWAVWVNETGKVCEVFASRGGNAVVGKFAGNDAWLGSRSAAAQKAFSANAFSTDTQSISTGYMYAEVVPNDSLYGLQHSNPVDYKVVSDGDPVFYAKKSDGLMGQRPGGISVIGGGVALYNNSGEKIGAVGISGDSSCRDHAVAYRTRFYLNLDNQPTDDGLVLIDPPVTLGDHPTCASAAKADPPTATGGDIGTAADFGIRP